MLDTTMHPAAPSPALVRRVVTAQRVIDLATIGAAIGTVAGVFLAPDRTDLHSIAALCWPVAAGVLLVRAVVTERLLRAAAARESRWRLIAMRADGLLDDGPMAP